MLKYRYQDGSRIVSQRQQNDHSHHLIYQGLLTSSKLAITTIRFDLIRPLSSGQKPIQKVTNCTHIKILIYPPANIYKKCIKSLYKTAEPSHAMVKIFYDLMHFIVLCMCKCIKPLINSLLVETVQALHSLHFQHFIFPYVHSLPHCCDTSCSDPMLTGVNFFLRNLR
jgi:hypothetical protein